MDDAANVRRQLEVVRDRGRDAGAGQPARATDPVVRAAAAAPARSDPEARFGWWLTQAEEQAKQAADATLERKRAAIGVPPKFQRLLESGVLAPTRAIAEIKGCDMLLFLAGEPGVGKTVAACCWLVDGWEKGSPLFVTAAQLSRWPRYEEAKMQRLLEASRLVIDDLGEEYSDVKGNFRSVFGEVVSARLAADLPTVITTNLSAKIALGAGSEDPCDGGRYGTRIRDRLRESGRWYTIAGTSMRGKP